MDVAMCIQVSIENYHWCFPCVTDPGPHNDATSVERPDRLQATSCMFLTPATPNPGVTIVLESGLVDGRVPDTISIVLGGIVIHFRKLCMFFRNGGLHNVDLIFASVRH